MVNLDTALYELGFPKDFEIDEPFNCSKEGIFYLYDSLKKYEQGNLSFIEALDIYTMTHHGKGLLVLLTEENEIERISSVLNKELNKIPYLGYFMSLPDKFKKIIEKNIYTYFQENKKNEDANIIIEKSKNAFYSRFVYTKDLKEREIFLGMLAKAGYSFFGKHFTEFEQDIEKATANVLYVMFENNSYNYYDSILKEKGRLKILKKLDDLTYLNKRESREVRKHYNLLFNNI